MSSEDEVIRQLQEKMMAELASKKKEEEAAAAEQAKIDAIVKQVMTLKAWERLKRVELVKPDLAYEVKLYLLQLYSSGRLTRKVTDEELKALLAQLSERRRRDFNIRIV